MQTSPAIATAEQADNLSQFVLCALELLGEAALFRFTRAEQLDHGRNLEALSRALHASRVGWVRELEDSGAATELSYTSTRTLLTDVLHLGVGEAGDLVRAATLTLPGEPLTGGHIPAVLPQVGAALRAGELGAGHVAVITKAVKKWPKNLDPSVFDACEQLLVDQARQVDPGTLTTIAQHLENIVDPDGTAPDGDPEPANRMELTLGVRNPRTGLTPIKGTLCDEAVEAFRQAIDPLAAPRPATDGTQDPRTPAQRLAQAHLDVLRGYLAAGDGPTNLNNGALLCGFHHRLIHCPGNGWHIRIAADGRPDFIPPEHLDPHQQPRRNHRLPPMRT